MSFDTLYNGVAVLNGAVVMVGRGLASQVHFTWSIRFFVGVARGIDTKQVIMGCFFLVGAGGRVRWFIILHNPHPYAAPHFAYPFVRLRVF